MEHVLASDFKEFLKLLHDHEVKYLLIGGYAVNYHGYVRGTGDLDVWIAVHPDNANKVVEVLQEFGFGVPELTPELFLKSDTIVRMGVQPVRIEISTSISGVNFEICYAERVTDMIDDIAVSIISLHHLKINKQASGRLKDLADLENLP